MKLLLDTHTFLRFLDDSARLSSTAKALIEDGANEAFVSDPACGALSPCAIMRALGKPSGGHRLPFG